VRRLIVNADDFGLTAGVNRAILEAHHHGIVTSATLMACGPKFSEAARLIQTAQKLSVGCHVVLVDGIPLADPQTIPTLLSKSPAPRFQPALARFARAAFMGRMSAEEIETEATAQIQKLQAAGVSVSHFDTHKHTHAFPRILKPLLRAAKMCGVKAVRNPFELPRSTRLRIRDVKRTFQVKALRLYAGSFKQAVSEAGLVTPDGALGITATGVLDGSHFRELIKTIPEGTWELVCHPGYNDSELAQVRTRLRQSRQRELELLTSSEARELLNRHGITLISYRDLI
jgi:hopanoid biosynthesis associated protein HpnK